MDPVAGAVVAATFGLTALVASTLRKRLQERDHSDTEAWQIAAAKLGLSYHKRFRSRVLSGRYEGHDLHVAQQPDPEGTAGQWLTTFRASLRGPLPRFTIVRTSSFMNPHDDRLRLGDPEFDSELTVIRPVRSSSSAYFTDARRRIILDVFRGFRHVSLNGGHVEVGIGEISMSAQDLVETARWLVRKAKGLSIETDRRGNPVG